MKDLYLPLTKHWFEMTKSGEKTEDYREITEYWLKRLFNDCDKEYIPDILHKFKQGWDIESIGEYYLHYPKIFNNNIMTLGYPKITDTSRILKIKHEGIEVRTGKREWGADPDKFYFVIKHGFIK